MHELTATHDLRSTDPETGVAPRMPEAAICVQDIDVQCVLQFTLIHAAGCALHRHTSRVIHRLELYILSFRSQLGGAHGARAATNIDSSVEDRQQRYTSGRPSPPPSRRLRHRMRAARDGTDSLNRRHRRFRRRSRRRRERRDTGTPMQETGMPRLS